MDPLDALYDAAIAGDVDAVAKLGMEADILNDDEQTILHVESKNGNTERVRFIVREFASKNLLVKLDNQQETALMWAAYLGHTEVVEVLIDAARNLPPSSPNENGVSSFQAFLRQGDKDSDTALHSAVFQGNLDIVKLLVEADPTDPHTQNDEGKTPMFIAVEKGYNEIVEIISTTCTAPSLDGPDSSILMRVKNLDQGESRGGTLYKIMDRDALYDAAISGDADVIAILEMKTDILNEYGETILHIESESGNTEHVRFILREFVNKNLLDKLNRFKQTALHLAVSNGHTDVVKVIIEAARQNFQGTSFQDFLRQGDQDNDTALHAAVMEGNIEIVKLLVQADPTDTHTQNDIGETPMYMAVEQGLNDIVEIISTTCTAPSLDGPDGSFVVRINTPDQVKSPGEALYKITDRDDLFDAAIAGDDDAIARLEMNTDTLSKYGETILHTESESGNTEHVRFILREFASKNLLAKLTIYKHTALHQAIYRGHTEVAEVIIQAARQNFSGTSFQDFLRQGDKDNDTALHAAVMEGNVAIVKLLVEADPHDTHIQNDEGKTPMYMAVEQGYNEIVEIISTICTAPSLDGPGGSTALHAAVRNDNNSIEVVKVLIDAARRLPSSAPDNENTDSIPVTSLQSSIASDNDRTDEDDDDDGDDDDDASTGDNTDPNRVTSFQASSSDNDNTDDNPVSSVQAFLRRVDEDGNTALHIAVMQRNLETAKLLVESDPSYEGTLNKKGETPFYIAVEKGYADTAKMIGTACTTPHFLYGPGGNMSALHAVIRYLDEANNEVKDVIEMIIDQIKKHNINASLDEIFYETDEDGCTILEVAVELNKVAVVNFILDLQHPASKRKDGAFISLVPVIYKAQEKDYKNIVQLLTDRYNDGSKLSKDFKDQVSLISAIRSGKTDAVFDLLVDGRGAQRLVTFVDKLGWTALHHAVYHESNPIIKHIADAQKGIKPKSGYHNKVLTPFHVAAQRGRTSIVVLLMQLWSSSSSTYTAVNKKGQNILHLAALQSKTDMIEGILKNCPEEHKKEFVNKQNNDGNTTIHLLIQRGCFVPELLKYEGLDTSVQNMEKWTPWDMLYFRDQVIKDQVKIKVALDYIQIDRKRDIFSSSVLTTSQLEKKDVNFREEAKKMTDGMLALMKVNTGAVTKCYADAIAGDPISRAALEMEADTPNEAGETILHVESKKGAIENIRFILSAFANKNLLVRLDNRKQTALSLAAHHGHTKVVDALLSTAKRNLTSSSANDDAQNPVTPFQTYIRQANVREQNTALHLAVLKNDVAIVKLLVKADPNDKHVQNWQGKTPIYIAAEKGFKEIVKEICGTCTALSLDGPGGRATVLHAVIQNIGQVKEGASDIIRTIIHAAKRRNSADFEAFFGRTNELGITVLQLAVENNCVEAVRLIVQEDPAYQHGPEIKRNGLMPLIFKAIDNECSDDIIKLLSQTYEAGIINPDHKEVVPLILAMRRRDKDSVLRLLEGTKNLVTFTEDNGWTPLHYAVYHEFDSVLGAIIGAQEDVKHQFVYEIPTPFHVAVERGYTSTLVRLMQLWPAPSSSASRVDNPASGVDNSPYTVVNKDGQNILHLVAADNGNIKADNRKEMVEGILKYCPKSCKDKILKQQDSNGDTPLHVLISSGCFIPELIKDEELDTVARNKNNFTAWEMLYVKNDVVADQVLIKIALDDITLGPKTRRNNIFSGSVRTRKNSIFSSSVPPSKRRIKDVLFDERKQKMMKENEPKMKEELERYRQGTNSQVVVSALITTITFTVGFTMPGGLHQSGEDNEGLTVLSKRAAFNTFMIFDSIALLLSACSLFIYFLESMSQNLGQLTKLHATTIVLNIVSVVMMMLVFMTGTYVVLSESLALAITVCVIGSLFFVFVVVQLLRVVNDYRLQKNKDHEHEA
ncbi:uncharacterized protein LOC141723618 [Apium graveolens]|uniref:uncharacterized protein LOC141723618 n=1 Tax=Apium graveolens TaxID=4045 RepID=UPI003D793D42